MFRKARFVVVLALSHYAMAGWFGGDEEEKPRKRRGRQEDVVPQEYEVDPDVNSQYRENKREKRRREKRSTGQAYYDEMSRDERAQHHNDERAEMNRVRSRNREEMMTEEYNQQILQDTLIEETHTSEENMDGYLTDADINKIWAEHMHDFVPEDMTNVLVESRTTVALFETINHVEATKIKGAYYVLAGNTEKIVSCIVYDPDRDVVYKRQGSAQGIILFDTTVPGEYSFIFSNMDSGQDLTVTLALHTAEEKEEQIAYDIDEEGVRFVKEDRDFENTKQVSADEVLGEDNLAASQDEIAVVKGKLRDIQVSIKQLQSEQKLSVMRLNGHNEDMMENQDWNFYFMLIETAFFFGIVGFQTQRIKNMLDNKLVI